MDNYAVEFEGSWYRVVGPDSAVSLARFVESGLAKHSISGVLPFERLSDSNLDASLRKSLRCPENSTVLSVPTIQLITYPWEWPDDLLYSAAQHTLDLRGNLLNSGLELKDGSALNIQFDGIRPVLMDIGSITDWSGDPSWIGLRQFMEHFVNPLALASRSPLSTSSLWDLGGRRGVTSRIASVTKSGKSRRPLGLRILQSATTPSGRSVRARNRNGDSQSREWIVAHRASTSLNHRLRKIVDHFGSVVRKTTWHDYSSRCHYKTSELDRKCQMALDFVGENSDVEDLVLDVGGNDGLVALKILSKLDRRFVVADSDSGSVNQLAIELRSMAVDIQRRITPLCVDVTNMTTDSGLLNGEFLSFSRRVRPRILLCHAVVHHLAITQSIPFPLLVEIFSQFGCPVQFEVPTETDPKVIELINRIPTWRGTYSIRGFLEAADKRFANVIQRGWTTPTRLMVECHPR